MGVEARGEAVAMLSRGERGRRRQQDAERQGLPQPSGPFVWLNAVMMMHRGQSTDLSSAISTTDDSEGKLMTSLCMIAALLAPSGFWLCNQYVARTKHYFLDFTGPYLVWRSLLRHHGSVLVMLFTSTVDLIVASETRHLYAAVSKNDSWVCCEACC